MAEVMGRPAEMELPEEATIEDIDDQELVKLLSAYNHECEEGRPNREGVWDENLDLYWQRLDYSQKADHQAQNVMPQVPQFVDRFAATTANALFQSGQWYTIDAPDELKTFVPLVRGIIDHWLSRAGEDALQKQQGFEMIFEDMIKMGALAHCALSVTVEPHRVVRPESRQQVEMIVNPDTGELEEALREDVVLVDKTEQTVSINVLDPRHVYRDPTGRGLYRRLRKVVDYHTLMEWADMVDEDGNAIWNKEAIERLKPAPAMEEHEEQREVSGDSPMELHRGRQEIVLDEYYGTLVNEAGEVIGHNVLVVMANEVEIVRGPESNPFWHGKDWVITGALMRMVGAVYGRTYLESWSGLYTAFNEMTNLLQDAMYYSSIKAFAGDPTKLEDVRQIKDGVRGGVYFKMQVGESPEEFLSTVDLGRFPQESVQMWSSLKGLMQEGAVLSDIDLGNIPPKSDITATEISSVQQSTSAIIRSVAATVERTLLDPTLDLVWQTALQHLDLFKPEDLAMAVGPELAMELLNMSPAARLTMIKGPYTFKARGLTAILDRSDQVRRLMGLFGILQQMPNLGQAVYEKYDLSKVPDLLIESFGFDAKDLGHGERPQEQVQMARAEREAAEAQGYSQEVDPEGATRDTPEDKMMQKEEEEGGAG